MKPLYTADVKVIEGVKALLNLPMGFLITS